MAATAVLTPETKRPRAATDSDDLIHVPNEFLLKQVNEMQERLGVNDAKLAPQIGYTPSVISTYKRGVYQGRPDKVEKALENWVNEKRDSLRIKQAAFGFIEFEVHQRTTAFLRLAKAGNYLMVLVGPAGLGKTQSAKEFQRTANGVLYLELTQDACFGAGLIRVLARALGARRSVEHPTLTQAVIAKIRERQIMLIIDKAHQLRPSGIEMMFDIRDAAKQPIVAIGNEKLLKNIEGRDDPQMEENEQWASRVDLKSVYEKCYDAEDSVITSDNQEPAHWYSAAEIKQFVSMYPIALSAALLRRCRKIADGPGHIRALDARLRLVMQFINDMEPLDALAEAERYAFKMQLGRAAQDDETEGQES